MLLLQSWYATCRTSACNTRATLCEELDQAAQRSVVAEVESAIEGGACLLDEAGRERALALCSKVRQTARKLARDEHLQQLQRSSQKARGAPSAQTDAAMGVEDPPDASSMPTAVSKGCLESTPGGDHGSAPGRIPRSRTGCNDRQQRPQ